MKDLAVKQTSVLDLTFSKDVDQFQQGIDIVTALEERESTGQEGQKDDADRPDIDRRSLGCAFEQNFGSTKATGTSPVCPPARPGVVLGIAQLVLLRGQLGHVTAGLIPSLPVLGGILTQTGSVFRSLTLGQSKVNQDTALLGGGIKKIGRLDITVYNPFVMDGPECCEQAAEICLDFRYRHLCEKVSKVVVGIVRQDGNDLVVMTKGSDEWTHGFGISQVVEELELIEDTRRAARHINLFYSHILGRSSRRGHETVGLSLGL